MVLNRLLLPLGTRVIDALMAVGRRSDGERVWLVAVLALSAIPAVSALVRSFSSAFVVQDDARQFLFWMARWDDPGLFHDDVVAGYWYSVSPWLFADLYRALDAIGIPPLIAAKLIPPVLIVLTACYAFRLAHALGRDAIVAFVAALAVLIVIAHEDSVFSATPRGFALPLFLIALDGVVRGRVLQAAAGQFLAAAIYPHIALVALGIAGLTVLRFEPRLRLDLSVRWLAMIAAMTAATAGGLLPILLDIGRYGPVVDLNGAGTMPAFGHDGRIPVLTKQGVIDRLCSPVIGLEPRLIACNGPADPRFLLTVIYLGAPAAFFAWYRLRQAKAGPPTPIGVEIYLYALIVGLAGFAIAWQVPFRLYWPGRFVLRPLTVLLPLEYGHLVGLGIASLLARPHFAPGGRGFAKMACGWGFVVVLVAAAASLVAISPRNRRPNEVPLIQAIAALPPQTVAAGFVMDMDFVPVLAKRSALFTWEHSVPIHLGYFRQIEERMRDMVEAEFTPEPGILAADLTRWSVGVYVIRKDRLADPEHGTGFESFVPDAFARGRERRQGAATALSRLAPACTIKEFGATVMLDAACLVQGGTRLGAR
jgi:hypothetical protein